MKKDQERIKQIYELDIHPFEQLYMMHKEGLRKAGAVDFYVEKDKEEHNMDGRDVRLFITGFFEALELMEKKQGH